MNMAKQNTEISTFATDPDELKPEVYVQLKVVDTIKSIGKKSSDIMSELSKLYIDEDLQDNKLVVQLIDIEKMTLSALYKQIVYHNHMIDQLMITLDDDGVADAQKFFAISELSNRATSLMSNFTIFIRSLPQHLENLNVSVLTLVDIDDDDDESDAYAGTTASKGDEELINRIEQIQEQVEIQHNKILNTDLESEVDVDQIDDTVE